MNKYASEQIMRLQKNNFNWEDKPFNKLIKEYPNCKSSLKWWTGQYTIENGFKTVSRFDVGYNKWLKEFLIAHPPTFKISNKCCTFAKKDVSKKIVKKHNIDLMIIGVRRAEGGIRSTAYKSCFSEDTSKNVAEYRPIFWYTDQDKKQYKENQNITYSDCYTKYGFERTGCACCPYGYLKDGIQKELKALEQYEPKLHKAVNNIFKDSYEYTKKYYDFRAEMEEKEKQIDGQQTFY